MKGRTSPQTLKVNKGVFWFWFLFEMESPFVTQAGLQVGQSRLTVTSTSRTQVILPPQLPEELGLQACAPMPG